MAKIIKDSPDQTPDGPKKTNVVKFITEGFEAMPEGGMEAINHIPYVDMYSTAEEIVVEAEIPGIRKEDIEISIFKNTLNIKAQKYECFDEGSVNYVCMERAFGRVFRTIEIPLPVNTSKIRATYNDGILKIVMPRIEEKRGAPKKIEVE